MKHSAVVLSYAVLTVLAKPQSGPSSQYGAPNSGYSDDAGGPVSYEFNYDVEDQEKGVKFGHKEERQDKFVKGEYYVLLPDGRTQHVVYTADETGYHPTITYEGTANSRQGYGGGPAPSGSGYA